MEWQFGVDACGDEIYLGCIYPVTMMIINGDNYGKIKPWKEYLEFHILHIRKLCYVGSGLTFRRSESIL